MVTANIGEIKNKARAGRNRRPMKDKYVQAVVGQKRFQSILKYG